MLDLATPVAAFILGAALARANSCTVASAQRLVFERRADWLLGLGIAIAWAGLTLTIIGMALPQIVLLPAQLPVTRQIVAGGVLLGLGAAINQGCFLGSVARLGRGDVVYGFTLVGIGLAMAFATQLLATLPAQGPVAENASALRPAHELLWPAAFFLPLAAFGLWRWLKRRRQPVLALIVVGVAGGTVYACNPDWSYSSGLYRLATRGLQPGTLNTDAGAIAVLSGVIVSALIGRSFALSKPKVAGATSRLMGGFIMGSGALLVPGGNDTLMLWAIPGQTFYGLTAYLVMIATILAIMVIRRTLSAAKVMPPTNSRIPGAAG